MDYRTFISKPRPQALAVPLLIAIALATASCGSANDDEPGLTNVEPREGMRRRTSPRCRYLSRTKRNVFLPSVVKRPRTTRSCR